MVYAQVVDSALFVIVKYTDVTVMKSHLILAESHPYQVSMIINIDDLKMTLDRLILIIQVDIIVLHVKVHGIVFMNLLTRPYLTVLCTLIVQTWLQYENQHTLFLANLST